MVRLYDAVPAEYDDPNTTYEGTRTADTRLQSLSGFTSPFVNGPRFYIGLATLTVTAAGTGAGTQTAVGVRVVPRTATGAGVGTQTAVGVRIPTRTATGTGVGTQTAIGVLTAIRIATGTGVGTQTASGEVTRARTATGTGVSSETASGTRTFFRTATGTGTGSQTVVSVLTAIRTATGTGAGIDQATGVRVALRTASGSAVSSETPATWVKSLIFRPPVEDQFPWSDYREQRAEATLFGKLNRGNRARNIFRLTNGTYTNVDPREPALIERTYYGGHEYFVDEAEKAELVAAGYTVT